MSNLHLGRLLVRRFGEAKALKFFELSPTLRDKPKQLQLIREFITRAAGERATSLNVMVALEQHTLAQEGYDEADGPAYYSRRGIDYRKPTGDVYEALVGLLLIELDGHCDQAWEYLRADFFPDGASAQEDAIRLSKALSEARMASAKREAQRRSAQQGRTIDVASTADAVMAEAPTLEAPLDAMPGAAASAEKRLRSTLNLDERTTCKCVCRTEPTGAGALSAAGSSEGEVHAASAPLSVSLSAGSLPPLENVDKDRVQYHGKDPVQFVNELLAREQIHNDERKRLLAEEVNGESPFVVTVRVSGWPLGCGRALQKKPATRLAYYDMITNRRDRLTALVAEWKQQPRLAPSPAAPSVLSPMLPPPASHPAPPLPESHPAPPLPVSHPVPPSTLEQTAAAPLPNRPPNDEPTGEVLARRVALQQDVAKVSEYLAPLPRYDEQQEPEHTALRIVLEALREQNDGMQAKIAKLIMKSCIHVGELESVAHVCRLISGQCNEAMRHSPGRLFHDALLAFVTRALPRAEAADTQNQQPPPPLPPPPPAGPASSLSKLPTSLPSPSSVPPSVLHAKDRVRIVGLQSAAAQELNGTIGTIGEEGELNAETQRFPVLCEARPKEISLKRENLQLLRLGEAHLGTLSPAARQLCYYLQGDDARPVERDMFTWPQLIAHHFELPLYLFNTFHLLRAKVLDAEDEQHGRSFDPHARLDRLRAAVRDVPTLELCGPFYDRVRRREDGSAARAADKEAASAVLKRPAATPPDVPLSFDALRLPAGGAPHVVQLPTRTDYLHMLQAEALGGHAPLGLHARYVGQTSVMPMLYFLIHPPNMRGGSAAAHNVLASQLASFDIWGDAILSDVQLCETHDEPWLYGGGSVAASSLAACESFIAERLGGMLGFMLKRFGRPLLGNWELPRRDAWPIDMPPRALLNEWLDSPASASADGALPWCERHVYAVHVDADGHDEPNTPYQCRLTTDACREQQQSAGALPDLTSDGHVELRSEPCRSKNRAEDDACLQLMHRLVAGQPAASALQILDIVEEYSSVSAPAEIGLPAGTHVTCSWTLYLRSEPEGGDGGDGTRVELERSKVPEQIVLGGGVMHPSFEGYLSEVGAQWQAHAGPAPDPLSSVAQLQCAGVRSRAALSVLYHGQARRCVLELSVVGVQLAAEESEYELAGCSEPGAVSLGEQRMRTVMRLLREVGATNLTDVGCGEAKLLLQLLSGESGETSAHAADAPPPLQCLIGIDVDAKALGRAKRKLTSACGVLASPPEWSLIGAPLADVPSIPDVISPPPDAMTLVEVVEHLPSPALASQWVGALLGRCKPRILVVTTPNVEYNLNMMVQCSRPTQCPKRQRTMDAAKLEAATRAKELCKGCALFVSGRPPPSYALYPPRCDDHKFEWTRAEFAEWANALGSEHGFDVRFERVGGGAWDEQKRTDDPFHGPGPSSQVAIFEARVAPGAVPGAAEDEFGDLSAGTPAPAACAHARR